MKLAIGVDHRGYALKEYLKQQVIIEVNGEAIEWHDVGCDSDERCDYPPFAIAVAYAVQDGSCAGGVLICGSGNGMAIAANRFSGIYAALAWDVETARLAKSDDNANILVLPANFIGEQQAHEIVRAWLRAEFKEGRYRKRLMMIDELGGV